MAISEKTKSSLGGVILTLIGCILCYFFILGPIEAAKNHESEVSLSGKLMALGCLLIVMGALQLIFHDREFKKIRESKLFQKTNNGSRPSIWGWFMFGIIVALIFTLYLYVRSILSSYGYDA